jgi:two-component system sensor histidine kinase QseC
MKRTPEQAQENKSLFASFSSEKEESSFLKERSKELLFSWHPRWSSLRFRLMAAMIFVFIAAVGASSIIDRLSGAAALAADDEPYQDGLVLACYSLAVLVLIWLVSQWSLRPLSRASAEAARAGPRNPGLRLTTARLPSEIRPLAEAVNGALDRMERAYEAERRFTADAAHELRTPLSVLSLRLQSARIEGHLDWDAVGQDVQQMTHLVNQLLDLARKEQAGRDPALAPVNLARVAREAAAMITPLAEQARRALDVDLPENLPVRGREDDLRDILLNLLDNALKHGKGTIGLSGTRHGNECLIDVHDEGPGVAPDMREAVFARFRKVQANTSGTGLGLAIVREGAESQGGSAYFLDRPYCTVRLALPEDKEGLLF